ncbi:MAG: hypothetical protein P1V35_15330 [Planctomycetota bacterium]|nr:hypothetical protein [Planctomycetota bacterium]
MKLGIKNTLGLALALALCGSASATDLDLTIVSGGASAVTVGTGDMVSYGVYAETTDGAHQGLAMFAFDLTFDGGALSPVSPTSAVTAFVAPNGINNPAGFGGTPSGGDLIQVGGAQNTILNTFAPQPVGVLQPGLAMPAAPVFVATGALVAPTQPGTYVLSAQNLFANVLDPTTTGTPFWKVLPCEAGTMGDLVITVVDCDISIICPGDVNSAGCQSAMLYAGRASYSGSSALTVGVGRVINEEFGLWIWGTNPGPSTRFGTNLCVGSPFDFAILPELSGGGGPGGTTCDGSFRFQFTGAFLQNAGLTPGTTVYTQCVYRDPLRGMPSVGVSPAMSFVVCP